jgi:NAD(P)-dependent dehydrogenase (short-subunit alcohol dehydrogenase family)
MSFQGQQVLVVGGTSGIGAGIAVAFAAQGAQVVATGATAAECEAADARSGGGDIRHCLLDVRDGAAVQSFVEGLGALHAVVCCAGVIRRGAELDPAVFAEVVDINLNGTMRVAAAARPALKATKGCIVNTASMLSFFGGGLVPGYSASKGGVAQLTKSLAIAYAADGIRVNAVAPGWIATPLGHARRCGSPSAVPVQPGGGLRHGRGAAGGWRLPDRLNPRSMLSACPQVPILP